MRSSCPPLSPPSRVKTRALASVTRPNGTLLYPLHYLPPTWKSVVCNCNPIHFSRARSVQTVRNKKSIWRPAQLWPKLRLTPLSYFAISRYLFKIELLSKCKLCYAMVKNMPNIFLLTKTNEIDPSPQYFFCCKTFTLSE